MPISSLPGANPPPPEHKNSIFVLFWPPEAPFSGLSSTKLGFLCFFGLRDPRFLAFRAQNRGFCALLTFGTLIFRPFKHKIGVFVLFWPSGPSFSGVSSTKLGFLCFFDLRNPHFRAFRAQNRGFCALLPEGGRPLAGDAYGKKVYIQGTMPELRARGQNCEHGARDAGTMPEMRRGGEK